MSTWIEAVARSGVAAMMIALPLVACGDGVRDPIGPPEPPPPEPTSPPSFVVAVVSGDNQPGRAGRLLPAPFVVRVTNDRGEAAANMTVTWTVTTGQGSFTDDGISNACWHRLSTTSVQTDADGLAQVPFIPAWIGPVTVTARPTGTSNSVTFTTDASDAGAVLRLVSEQHLVRKAGEWVDGVRYADLLAFQVTDGQGNPVPHVAMVFAITSGDAWLDGCAEPGSNPALRTTRTRPDGTAFVNILPTTFGTTTLAAAVPGVLVSPVTLTLTVTAVVINLGQPWDSPIGFFGPDVNVMPTSDVTVPIGATVEWVNHLETARIVSAGAAPGGISLDSGVLARGERFQFVPDVAGTWEYIDQVSGATGRLTAR
jgi:hypothetical protein